MNIGLSTLNNIGNNYYVRLNDKEILVYEKDPLRSQERSPEAQTRKEIEKQEKIQKQKEAQDPQKLSEGEKDLLNRLEARDSEVKIHEASHQAAGGGLTGAASYTYQQGPDGKLYAIGGEVSISMPTGSTPEETIANAKKIAASAMAASSPSPQDFSVAASARMMEMKAQQQKNQQQQQHNQGLQNYQTNSLNQQQNSNTQERLPLDITT